MKVKSISVSVGGTTFARYCNGAECNAVHAEIPIVAYGNRIYKLEKDVSIHITYGDKVNKILTYNFKAGFKTNFRSGCNLIDPIVDQIGDVWHQVAWLIHDANYTPCDDSYSLEQDGHPLSKSEADELLGAMLEFAGEGVVKRNVVVWAVKLFGRSAYNDDDELTARNRTLFSFRTY